MKKETRVNVSNDVILIFVGHFKLLVLPYRVSELWEEVSVSLGVGSQDVILMTLEGQLMDKSQIIASYTSGTVSHMTLSHMTSHMTGKPVRPSKQ